MKARNAILSMLASLMLAMTAQASPFTVTITDPYGAGGAWNGSGGQAGANAADVIGSTAYWDIRNITLTINGSNVSANIRFNRNGNTNLTAPIALAGYNLFVGDLLFGTGPSSYTYGVSLSGHQGLTAGALYSLNSNNALSVYNSQNLPSLPPPNPNLPPSGSGGIVYRTTNNAVWINPGGATLIAGSFTTPTASVVSGSEISAIVNFTANASFLAALSSGLDVHFAAATCANDVIDGRIQHTVPEPTSILLLSGGLIGLAGLLKLRKK
jgi:hypothetical protein